VIVRLKVERTISDALSVLFRLVLDGCEYFLCFPLHVRRTATSIAASLPFKQNNAARATT
jgi:hypothetical protein